MAVTLKLRKCRIFTNTIYYLRHLIRRRCLDIASLTTGAYSGLKELTSRREFRSFLRLCNVFRQFVLNFARLAASLKLKLRNYQAKTFGPLNDKESKFMNSPRKALISPPILTLRKATGHMTLDTDACDIQVGFVLLQQPDGTSKPIEYWSRSLTDAECECDTTQRELFAIFWAVLLLCLYLEGKRFTIHTEHDLLK